MTTPTFLTAPFRALEARGILAREDYWCCNTCAVDALWKEFDATTGSETKTPARGYVFYHEQQTPSTRESPPWCYLGFDSFDTEVPDTVIAAEVVQHLRSCGLTVEWSGESSKKIKVTGV